MIGAELQKAIFSALTGASPELVGGRVYDAVPEEAERIEETGAAYPYITIGDENVLNNSNSCSDGWESFAAVHVWSRPENTSKLELKGIVARVVDLLNTRLTVTGFRTIVGEFYKADSMRDPDGITEHAILTFRYLLDPE